MLEISRNCFHSATCSQLSHNTHLLQDLQFLRAQIPINGGDALQAVLAPNASSKRVCNDSWGHLQSKQQITPGGSPQSATPKFPIPGSQIQSTRTIPSKSEPELFQQLETLFHSIPDWFGLEGTLRASSSIPAI